MNKRKKKNKLLIRSASILYMIIFLIITTPIVLFWGPYSNVRKVFISTLLGTRHAYLLTNIFSEETLNNMQGKESEKEELEPIKEDLSKISIACTTGNNIERYNIHTERYDAYILEIKNPLSVRVAMTKYLGKVGQKTSEMAEDNDAIAAINGGSFKDKSSDGTEYAGTGAEPEGFVISKGKVVYPVGKYDENEVENVAAITNSGHLIVGDHSLKELIDDHVMEAMCFRKPNILIDGVRQILDEQEGGLNPRTAIGQKADGTIIFLVIDGRKVTMPGASLYDVQEIMLQRGALNVAQLDGGYSSTMYYKGSVINSPNAWDGERLVATAFYVEN